MIRALAALALASAAATATAATDTDALSKSAPWWEKVTVTIAGDGQPQGCHFTSSSRPDAAQTCDVTGSPASMKDASAGKDQYTRITFERRFTPGAKPDTGNLAAGDTFLGGQVLALAIDAGGAVKACQIVASSGEMKPEYGCDEAKAERFQASAQASAGSAQIGYMTILVYGHAEHMV